MRVNANVDYAADARSDAALRLLRQPEHRREPRHRRVRLRGARLLDRELESQRPRAAHGAAGPPHVLAHADAGELVRLRVAFGARGADHSRARRVYARRRAARRRPAHARPQRRRATSTTCAAFTRYRAGLEFNALRVRADDTTNYLGTYTFESPEAFEEGRPRSYTQRVGDPDIRYNNLQAGAYVQDDMRLRRNLTFSAGMRYEAQTHVDDYDGLMPRVGVTWAPFKSGATTLRTSWGIFHDWLQRRHLRADAARGRLPPAGSGHLLNPTLSRRGRRRRRRRRPTATCSTATCACRAPTARASASISACTGWSRRPRPTPTSAGRRCIAG